MIGVDLPYYSPPGFHVRDATLDDVEDITRLWYASFNKSHKFFDYATPDNAATRKWFNQAWIIGILAGPAVLKTLVVEDLSKDNKLIAFGRIHVPQPNGNQEIPLPQAPAEWDPEITDALWGGIARNRASIMGQRLHWMGEFVGVEPGYQDKGVASALLEWGCRQADLTGLEFYLDATIKGLPIYKKHFGFEEVKSLKLPVRPSTYGTYEVVSMVRQPKRSILRGSL